MEPKRSDHRTPLLERAIAAVAPGWGAARAEARLRATRAWRAEDAVRSYDASSFSRRTQNWNPTSGSGAAAMGSGFERLRARARDLARNNEWMAKGLGVIEDDVVGSGFMVKFEHPDAGRAKEAAAIWKEWADSTQIDAAGLQDVSGLLGLAVRTMAESGEFLLRRRWRTPEDGLAVPLQIQLLEGDHLDHLKEGLGQDGSRTVQGVEHDPLGRRRAYWMFREHPGDPLATVRESIAVPASELQHVFREDRRGAVRGIPWGAPCLLRLRDIAQWEDAKLHRVMLANMFVCTIEMPEVITDFAPMGPDGKVKAPIESWKPGQVQYTRPGEKMNWSTPPEPGNDHETYLHVGLLAVAAGLQIPYEALTGDLRKTSFSSGRLGWLQWQRRIEAYRWRIVVPRACQPIGRWFLEALAIRDPKMLEVRMSWNPPHREMIDPTAEVASFEKSIRAGLTSRQDVVRSLGRDPAEVLREIAEDNKAQKDSGVMLTTDPANDLGRKPAGDPGRKAGEAANAPR